MSFYAGSGNKLIVRKNILASLTQRIFFDISSWFARNSETQQSFLLSGFEDTFLNFVGPKHKEHQDQQRYIVIQWGKQTASYNEDITTINNEDYMWTRLNLQDVLVSDHNHSGSH